MHACIHKKGRQSRVGDRRESECSCATWQRAAQHGAGVYQIITVRGQAAHQQWPLTVPTVVWQEGQAGAASCQPGTQHGMHAQQGPATKQKMAPIMMAKPPTDRFTRVTIDWRQLGHTMRTGLWPNMAAGMAVVTTTLPPPPDTDTPPPAVTTVVPPVWYPGVGWVGEVGDE